MRDLIWHERAQLKETTRVFIVFLLSISIMITIFGLGYYFLGRLQDMPRTLVECFYFIWITFATIGYTDEGFTGGAIIRVITIFVGAFLIVRFIVLTAHVYARVVVERVYDLKVVDEMKKALEKAEGHFLIFGDDRELINKIIQGLIHRQEVFLVSEDDKMVREFKQEYPDLKYIIAKASRAETVDQLRPEEAGGAYLLYRHDEKNILLAAMLEERVRIISSFSGNFTSIPRFRRLGVEPISPHFSGGLKIVSAMIRPQVAAFLDRYVFPENAPLQFMAIPFKEAKEEWHYVPLATYQDDKMNFHPSKDKGDICFVLGFRDPSSSIRKLGHLEVPELPIRTDRFLVLGGGIIGTTVISELMATKREVMVVEPSAEKIRSLKKRFGKHGIEYDIGDALSRNFNIEKFDGVAICTPNDEKNFTIGLDFVNTHLIRIARAVDDDMEFHYKKIGAIPVFVGRVGSARMLREVTNKLANEVLREMLLQSYRMDQVYITKPCTVKELKWTYRNKVIALCRENYCYFGPDDEESLKAGDTLIICGHIDTNRELRLAHRIQEQSAG